MLVGFCLFVFCIAKIFLKKIRNWPKLLLIASFTVLLMYVHPPQLPYGGSFFTKFITNFFTQIYLVLSVCTILIFQNLFLCVCIYSYPYASIFISQKSLLICENLFEFFLFCESLLEYLFAPLNLYEPIKRITRLNTII